MKNTIQITEANFDTEVLQSPVPVIADFYADWCGPCKMIAPVLEEIATEKAGQAKVVKINVDEESGLAQRFNVQSLPTLLYFVRGQVAGQTVGATGKKNIVTKLETAAAS